MIGSPLLLSLSMEVFVSTLLDPKEFCLLKSYSYPRLRPRIPLIENDVCRKEEFLVIVKQVDQVIRLILSSLASTFQ